MLQKIFKPGDSRYTSAIVSFTSTSIFDMVRLVTHLLICGKYRIYWTKVLIHLRQKLQQIKQNDPKAFFYTGETRYTFCNYLGLCSSFWHVFNKMHLIIELLSLTIKKLISFLNFKYLFLFSLIDC